MNNTVKIALGFLAGGTVMLIYQLKKKRIKFEDLFTAPDGNTYEQDKIYRDSQGQLFKNGRRIHFETPAFSENNQKTNFNHSENIMHNSIITKNVNYHQKGIRHH